jgi:hypothetical protein
MKITSVRRQIKPSSGPPRLSLGACLAAVALFGAAGGCAPVVVEAPFPQRPDTTHPGDLLGPFDGRVLDASTERPVAGAVVFASWGFERGNGLSAPAGHAVQVTETDSDGVYTIPRLTQLPPAQARVAKLTVIIYRRGFVSYRSDRRYDDRLPRTDFAQRGNQVRLERFPSGGSHLEHVRFTGGGGAIRRAMEGEIMLASLELAGSAPAKDEAEGGPLLDVSALLSPDELKAMTGYAGGFEVLRLPDVKRSARYDSLHLKATGRPESYDAAARVWRLGDDTALDERYEALRDELIEREDKDELGSRSLRARDGRIFGVLVLDRERGVVIKVTCGMDQCRDHDQVVSLARRVLARSARLGAPAPEPEPASDGNTKDSRDEKDEPERTDDAPDEAPQPERPFQLRPPTLLR